MFDVNVFVAECVPSAMSATMEPLSTTLGTFFSLFFSVFYSSSPFVWVGFGLNAPCYFSDIIILADR